MLSLIILCLLWIVSIVLFFISTNGTPYTDDKLGTILVIALISIIVYVFRKEKNPSLKKRFVTAFNLFLLSFLCVHFQRFADLLVFKSNIIRSEIYADKEVVLRAASICLIGLLSLLVGYTLAAQQSFHKKNTEKKYFFNRQTYSALTYLYLISITLFLYYNGNNYFSGPYSQEMLDMTKGTMNTYSVILVNCCMYSLTICNSLMNVNRGAISFIQYAKSYDIMYYLCGGSYLFLCLMLGDRGPLISFLLVYYFGYLFISKRRVGLVKILVIFFVSSFILNIIGLTRNATESQGIAKYNQEIMDVNSISPLTSELASSNRTVIYAVESTPSKYPYRYGLFTINNTLAIIPFSSSLLKAFGFSPAHEYAHSSQFLTWYEQGTNPYSGVGSSTIADIYLDFGPLGVVIITFLLGVVFRRIDMAMFSEKKELISLFGFVTCIVVFSQSVYIPRSMLIPVLRTIVWEFVFILLVLNFTKSKMR